MELPSLVAANAFSAFTLCWALSVIFVTCCRKDRLGSSVKPSIVGVLLRGSGSLPKVTCGWWLCSLLYVVNSVIEDLVADARI